MIQPKNQTEDLLLSITKKCQTPIEQTHRKAEETLEFEMTKQKNASFQSTNSSWRILDDWINRSRNIQFFFLKNNRRKW